MQTIHQSLATHIEEYTKRQLTYQSDALNAIRSILDIMGRFLCCSSHYWGIPIIAIYYGADGTWHNELSGVSRLPSLEAFIFGLLRHTDQGAYVHRRKGFPSWSWAE
jgi:hypothetical protein